MTYFLLKMHMSLYDWLMDRSASESQARQGRRYINDWLFSLLKRINVTFLSLSFVHTTIRFVKFRSILVYTESHGFKRWQGLIRHNDFPAAIYESTLAARQIARTEHAHTHGEHTLSSNVSDTRIHSTPRAIIDNRMEGRIDCQISSMNIKR